MCNKIFPVGQSIWGSYHMYILPTCQNSDFYIKSSIRHKRVYQVTKILCWILFCSTICIFHCTWLYDKFLPKFMHVVVWKWVEPWWPLWPLEGAALLKMMTRGWDTHVCKNLNISIACKILEYFVLYYKSELKKVHSDQEADSLIEKLLSLWITYFCLFSNRFILGISLNLSALARTLFSPWYKSVFVSKVLKLW